MGCEVGLADTVGIGWEEAEDIFWRTGGLGDVKVR